MKKLILMLTALLMLLTVSACNKGPELNGAWMMEPVVMMQNDQGEDTVVTAYYVFESKGNGYILTDFSGPDTGAPVRGDFTYTLKGSELTIDLSYDVPAGTPDPVTHSVLVTDTTLTFVSDSETITMTRVDLADLPVE